MFLLIDAYRDTQRYPEALQVLQQSLSEVIDRAMYIFYPKLLRLQGELELLLATSPQQIAAAERCFRKAIVICRRQQSRTLELRATVCLSRLWQTQGRHEQAQRMLQTLYDRFSEGFDRPDLRRARTLLDNMDDEG